MNDAWADALRGAWAELSGHPARMRQFRSQLLSPELPLNIYAALRAADNAPCLIVPTEVSALSLFEVGGFRLSAAPGDEGPLLVLSLEDLDRTDLFITVCSDAVQATAPEGEADPLAAFLTRLDAWRRFLKERRTGLARHEVIGLIGELIVLECLLEAGPGHLNDWSAPLNGLHDFNREGYALEVKTSAGVASSLHISGLDQLDDVGLRALYLIHVRLLEAPDGRSLGDVLNSIENSLSGDPARRAFSNALLQRGLMPDDTGARSVPVVSVRSLAGYRVGPRFPRLTRSKLPEGVREVQYDLELRALDRHAVDVDAVLSEFCGEEAA